MPAKLTQLGDRVVVEPLEEEQMTTSGIYLPDTAKEKPQQGKILSVGPGAQKDDGKRVPMEVKVGDTVLYAKYAGTEVKQDGKDLLILSERDILAILKK